MGLACTPGTPGCNCHCHLLGPPAALHALHLCKLDSAALALAGTLSSGALGFLQAPGTSTAAGPTAPLPSGAGCFSHCLPACDSSGWEVGVSSVSGQPWTPRLSWSLCWLHLASSLTTCQPVLPAAPAPVKDTGGWSPTRLLGAALSSGA